MSLSTINDQIFSSLEFEFVGISEMLTDYWETVLTFSFLLSSK